MSAMQQQQRERWKERGMVSILVTMLLMIVISLIVLGFAQISRRNQRQALDRQLSTQAFYAAEAGINDARNLIKGALISGSAIPPKSDCTPGSGATLLFYGGLAASLDPPKNTVSYSCLMVDPTPKVLQYNDIGTTGTIIPMTSLSGANLSTLKLSISTKDRSLHPANGCPSSVNASFSKTTVWTTTNCGFGVFRFDLVPTTGSLSSSGLQDKTMTSFLVPMSSGGVSTVAYPAAPPASRNGNNRVAMACGDTGCTMTITGLSANQYYMRVTSLYKEVGLVITGTDSSGNPILFKDAQAVIDATGKAQDVLRRVQVHVPLTTANSNQLSDYGLVSTDAICKRFAIMDGYFTSKAATDVSGLTTITSPVNTLCQ